MKEVNEYRRICAPKRTERSKFLLKMASVPTVSNTTSLPPYDTDRNQSHVFILNETAKIGGGFGVNDHHITPRVERRQQIF